jgi:hypothetical protein
MQARICIIVGLEALALQTEKLLENEFDQAVISHH